jgi:hypothetical protein
MFNFFKRKAEVLEHWIAFVEGFSTSAPEFYESVERELKARTVPGLELSLVEFAEGGVLSDRRLYLRMVRERLVFDVCAAPFGSSFFFSCRFAEIPVVVHPWQLLFLFCLLFLLGMGSLMFTTRLIGMAGLFYWFFGWITLLIGIVYVLRNAVAVGLKDLDAALIKSPVIGPLYEAWFRRETYYRHDTRLMYLEIVSGLVKRLAEDAVAAKGVKLLRQYQQAPILGELYRAVPPIGPEPPCPPSTNS